jgi:thiamine-phosphate pyrophosphorylase
VLLSEELLRVPYEEALAVLVREGVDVIQVREKRLPDRRFLERARQARAATRGTRTLLVVNDRVDLALLAEADGVHLGQDDLPVAEARALLGPGRIVGVSTHSAAQARAAAAAGADYLGVGPVFPTATKGYATGLGTLLVREVRAAVALPFVALGGITPENAGAVLEAGAPGLAVSSAILAAPDLAAAVRRFRELVDEKGVRPLRGT